MNDMQRIQMMLPSGGGLKEFFGDGSDGVLNTTGNVTFASTLNGEAIIKQYESIAINSGHILTVSQPNQGLILYSQGDVNIDGTIDMSQKAGLVPNGNIIPNIILNDKIINVNTVETGNLCIGGSALGTGSNLDNVFDGNSATAWSSSLSGVSVKDTEWLGYDMGVPKNVNKIIIQQWGNSNNAVGTVDLQYSDDGSTWTTSATISNLPLNTGEVYVSVPSSYTGRHRYWRIIARLGTDGSNWIVKDLAMFGSYNSSKTIPKLQELMVTTLLLNLKGGAGGNGGKGGDDNNEGASGGYGGSGRQNLGGFGGGGAGGSADLAKGGVGGGIMYVDLGGGASLVSPILGSNNATNYIYGYDGQLGSGGTGAVKHVTNMGTLSGGKGGQCLGSGGGGGGGAYESNGVGYSGGMGGSGQYAGGFILIISGGNININGIVQANGGAGGAGGNAGSNVTSEAGSGGGGGGAGGGVITVFHKGTYTNNGTVEANGGLGGSAGAGNALGNLIGTTGTSGSLGTIHTQQL